MGNNLEMYNKVRIVPQEAQRKISGGRMNGKTDINPMWRIKTLTEQFGPVGFGWYYTIDESWLEKGYGDEVAAFIKISLYVKFGDEWSKPIVGIGGNTFVTKEKSGVYTSDECYKMALTDAISVSCKALGIGANVYWEADKSKYNANECPPNAPVETLATEEQLAAIRSFYNTDELLNKLLNVKRLEKLEDIPFVMATDLIKRCENKLSKPQQAS